jgi:hypothetical protein
MTRPALEKLDAPALFDYFCDNARFMRDAPAKPYFIRLGSRCLFSADTMDLRIRFESWVREELDQNVTMARQRMTVAAKPLAPQLAQARQ